MFKDVLKKISEPQGTRRHNYNNLRASASLREENKNLRTSASLREENKNLRAPALSAGGNKKTSASPRPPREGFSLIEVVSFVMIVAISFVVLVLVFRNAGNFSMRGDLLTQASQLAVSRMEEIRSLKFEDLLDEDSVSETIGSITITSSVYYVDPEDDLETSVTGPTSIIRIVVTAASPETPAISISTLYLDR